MFQKMIQKIRKTICRIEWNRNSKGVMHYRQTQQTQVQENYVPVVPVVLELDNSKITQFKFEHQVHLHHSFGS